MKCLIVIIYVFLSVRAGRLGLLEAQILSEIHALTWTVVVVTGGSEMY